MLYKNGSFTPAHILAILTLLAIFLGLAAERFNILGLSKYIQVLSYTGSVLFHLLPGIAEVNKRLPLDNPMGLSVEDPINIRYYLIFTALIGVTILIQIYLVWKKKI